MRRYSTAPSISSGLVFSALRIPPAKPQPIPSSTSPAAAQVSAAEWTVSREVLLIVSSEVVRHQYVNAAGQSDEEAGKQGHENGGGAHRSQRCGACEPADHRHVRHIE